MKKMLIILIACMFLVSMLSAITVEKKADETIFEARRFIEHRDIVPVYTEHGLERSFTERGKPGVYVTITNPLNGETVSGTVTITVDSNDNPDIAIDGSIVGSGLSYIWETTSYSDGSHTIEASAKGHKDTITVTVSNGGSSNSPPTADFTYTKTDLTVDFTDQSSDSDGSISSWYWDFNDGATSTLQNPSHTYATDGTYSVSLTVTDNEGATDTTTQSIAVSSGTTNNPPTADFTYTTSDLTAYFTDQSTDTDGSINSWDWDFGDGSTSTAANPTHTYATDGTYTVGLTVTDDDGAPDSTSQSVTVSSGTTGSMHVQDVYLWLAGNAGPWQHIGVQATIVDSSNNPLGGVAVDLQLETPTGSILTSTAATDSSGIASTVFEKASRTSGVFTGTVTGLTKSGYTWDTSADVETSDTYGGGSSNSPPTADFTYTKTDLTVDFTDQSTDTDGSINSWGWDFGDGSTSTAANPTHTYATDGTYTVGLTVTDDDGAPDSTSQSVTVSSGSGTVNKYALVIGISDYEGWQNDLQYCDDDANDWKNFLQSQGYTVTTLIDSQATAANIEAEIDNLINIEDGDDHVVLTYSGHGDDYSSYGSCIISQDLYYLSHGFFESKFSNAESNHIYFTFDACLIGDFQGLITSNRFGAFGSNNQYSYDGDSSMQNGVFTYYQIEGWDIYNDFEGDSNYAVQQMENWALSTGYTVDPFYVDQYSGSMYP